MDQPGAVADLGSSRIGDRDDFPFLWTCGQHDGAQIADRCAAERAGERAVPADATGAGIGLVVADQRDGAPGVVLVGKLDGGAEPDAVLVELRRGVDDARGLHAPGEEGEAAVDLTQPLAAIDIVAILAAVAVARGPTDDLDQLRAFLAEQP